MRGLWNSCPPEPCGPNGRSLLAERESALTSAMMASISTALPVFKTFKGIFSISKILDAPVMACCMWRTR